MPCFFQNADGAAGQAEGEDGKKKGKKKKDKKEEEPDPNKVSCLFVNDRKMCAICVKHRRRDVECHTLTFVCF